MKPTIPWASNGQEFKIGDRIKLLRMGQDPNPIDRGTLGTVTGYSNFGDWAQVSVDWDNGRKLMVCLPDDQIVKGDF